MANNLVAGSPTLWAKVAGYKLYKSTIAPSLACFDRKELLSEGRIVDRPRRADLVAEQYNKGGMSASDIQDISYTSDQLTVNKSEMVWFKIDDIDSKQNKYNTMLLNSEESGRRLAILQDAQFLYEATNQVTGLDDGDFGGSSGNGISLTTSNIDDLFGAIVQKQDEANVPLGERAIGISPFVKRVLWTRIAGKESMLGDKTGEFGNLGTYNGLKLFHSNNLTCSARWTPANDPSNTQTLSIQGITFTFVTTIGTAAGNILTGGGTAATLDNLVALINAGGVGDGVLNVSLSKANQRLCQTFVAVDGTTYVDVYVKGANGLTLTTSDSNDPWSRHYQHNFALRPKYSVDMVSQINPSVETQRGIANGFKGDYAMFLQLYGLKTFYAGTFEGVNVKIDETLV